MTFRLLSSVFAMAFGENLVLFLFVLYRIVPLAESAV